MHYLLTWFEYVDPESGLKQTTSVQCSIRNTRDAAELEARTLRAEERRWQEHLGEQSPWKFRTEITREKPDGVALERRVLRTLHESASLFYASRGREDASR